MGRLQTRSWEKDDVKHYRTEIVGDSIQFGSKQRTDGEKAPTPKNKPQDSQAPEYPTEEEVDPNDIPY